MLADRWWRIAKDHSPTDFNAGVVDGSFQGKNLGVACAWFPWTSFAVYPDLDSEVLRVTVLAGRPVKSLARMQGVLAAAARLFTCHPLDAGGPLTAWLE